MIARGTAALASSVTLVCRKRAPAARDGFWDDVRQELRPVAQERLDFFWNQDIRGADFFISAIGPALSVFGKYERVTKLSGEEVTVGQFLDEVRSLVTNYALTKILHTPHTAAIDPESRLCAFREKGDMQGMAQFSGRAVKPTTRRCGWSLRLSAKFSQTAKRKSNSCRAS
jgi:adenine-specific DNA methylase